MSRPTLAAPMMLRSLLAAALAALTCLVPSGVFAQGKAAPGSTPPAHKEDRSTEW